MSLTSGSKPTGLLASIPVTNQGRAWTVMLLEYSPNWVSRTGPRGRNSIQ
ncbi:MAG: hypothetical protein MI923_28930 [Phycisphaerales bacterium]|nr:hypothetical protein [Phycisphaerales bacterium]